MQGFKHAGGDGKTRFYKNGKLALSGTLTGGLYLPDGGTVVAGLNSVTSNDEISLWDSRLGHMSMKNLKVLVEKGILDNKRINNMEFCQSCILGKNKKHSFNVGKHNSDGILRYVHADLWGSLNVYPSLSKKRYFLSIIDDYSKKV